MKLDYPKKVILSVVGLTVLAAIILFGVFMPAINYIKKTSEQTYQLRLYLEQKYEQALRARITRRNIEDIKSVSETFYSHIYRKGNELELITYIESLAAKHKVTQTIKSSNLDAIASNKIIIAIDLNGSYQDTLAYIADLESSKYFINVEQFQFTPVFDRGTQALSSANASLLIELYAN